jgi:molybdate-binding protein/DNA-binding transcriptional regulator YhcF (GntR family)
MMLSSRSYLYLQIAETIRRRIASGDLAPGDMLPSVRSMAHSWTCTPGTVSRAYAILADEGLVVGRPGKGTLVAPNPIHPQAQEWKWATLVNRAESYLLEALSDGHQATEAETALVVAISRLNALQTKHVPQPPTPKPAHKRQVRFAGSHDLIIDILARMLENRADHAHLSIEYVGSLGGLIALSRGEADLAGIHLWDKTTDTYNAPFVQRTLPGRSVALLTLAHRVQGLILPPKNPSQIHSLDDLTREDVTIINRQSGSGTRVWLDAQLMQLGIEPKRVEGYQKEAKTHFDVARAVAESHASVGLGIHSAAKSFGLDFIPLTKERYDLAIPEQARGRTEVQALVEVIRSDELKEAVRKLGGYDVSETGVETWISK